MVLVNLTKNVESRKSLCHSCEHTYDDLCMYIVYLRNQNVSIICKTSTFYNNTLCCSKIIYYLKITYM